MGYTVQVAVGIQLGKVLSTPGQSARRLLGCLDGTAVGHRVVDWDDGCMLGERVGPAEGKFSGHDCVNAGNDTAWLGTLLKYRVTHGEITIELTETGRTTLLKLCDPA